MKKMGKTIISVVVCFCPLVMQAQEVKNDSLPRRGVPSEISIGVSSVISEEMPLLMPQGVETPQPTLGGFPILSGSSYYSESKDEAPLKIAPNAIPHEQVPSMSLGPFSAYYSGVEAPGLMNRQAAGLLYRQNLGRFTFSPYVGMEKVNTGVYGFGNLTKATFGSTMSYQVNDWLTVGLYGQYVPTKTSDPRSVIVSPFMPRSNYGGFIEVMFNQHWGVGAKMGREFAPQKNGKWGWKNTTEFYPIYKK